MGDVVTAPQNLFGMVDLGASSLPTKLTSCAFNATRFAFDEIKSSSDTNFGIPRIEIESSSF